MKAGIFARFPYAPVFLIEGKHSAVTHFLKRFAASLRLVRIRL